MLRLVVVTGDQKVKIKHILATFVLVILGTVLFSGGSASAATPPDSCFDFDSGSGTIVLYYENENNNIGDPACPKDVDIPAEINGDAVLIIGESAFQTRQLTVVTIPESVTLINEAAFASNFLTTIVIPNSVTAIGPGSFAVNELSSITFGNSLTEIGSQAFYGNMLQSVEIPNSLATIGPQAFFANNPSYKLADMEMMGGSVPVAEYIETMVYVQLYTVNPANPNTLSDELVLESDIGSDLNNDSDLDDPFGGHLINPATVTLSYEDGNGNQLQANSVHTGANLTSYRIAENTTNDLGLYYRIGSSKSFTAPTISGYTAPSTINLTLSLAENEHTFIYTAASADSTGQLVETGDNWALVSIAAIIVMISAALAGNRTGQQRPFSS